MTEQVMAVVAATVRVGDVMLAKGEWWSVIGTQFSTPREGQVTFTIRPAGDQRAQSQKVSCGASVKVTLLRS